MAAFTTSHPQPLPRPLLRLLDTVGQLEDLLEDMDAISETARTEIEQEIRALPLPSM